MTGERRDRLVAGPYLLLKGCGWRGLIKGKENGQAREHNLSCQAKVTVNASQSPAEAPCVKLTSDKVGDGDRLAPQPPFAVAGGAIQLVRLQQRELVGCILRWG